MKVTLDLDELLQNKQITQAEYDKFSRFSSASTGLLGFNILVGFGVIAVCAAAMALVPTPFTAMAIGFCALVVGVLLLRQSQARWHVLANICLLVGALMAGAGLILIDRGSLSSMLIVTVLFAAIAIFAKSRLLAVLATLMLAGCVGVQTGYFHAGYSLGVQKPIYTVILFAIVAYGLHRLSALLPPAYEKIAVAAARTSVMLVNFGFWVGSLWGGHLSRDYGVERTLANGYVSPAAFAILWAVALLATGAWAWRSNRRWVLNTVATFLAINLYTQWFEYFDVNPGSLLIAGLVALAAAVGLHFTNSAMKQRTDAA
jgi:hypothetical protein